MMVIADTSPLIVLVSISHVDLLPRLFGQIALPPQVAAELARANRPVPVRRLIVAARIELTYHSNAIEGNTLSLRETPQACGSRSSI